MLALFSIENLEFCTAQFIHTLLSIFLKFSLFYGFINVNSHLSTKNTHMHPVYT